MDRRVFCKGTAAFFTLLGLNPLSNAGITEEVLKESKKEEKSLEVIIKAREFTQGEIIGIKVNSPKPIQDLAINYQFPWRNKTRKPVVPAIKIDDQTYIGVAGIHMESFPGEYSLEFKVKYKDGSSAGYVYSFFAQERQYEEQSFTIEERKVKPQDEETRKRTRREGKILRTSWQQVHQVKYWLSEFVKPVPGACGNFGNRRIINGIRKSPHRGEDCVAEKGEPILAINNGIITLATPEPMFYTGNTVVSEHGWGLSSLYAHLDTINVKKGQYVEKGQQIGTVGETGRATGPHLHWQVKLTLVEYNPLVITSMDIDPASLVTLSRLGDIDKYKLPKSEK